jgi:hypothetical protein
MHAMMARKLIIQLTSSVFLSEIQRWRRRMEYEDRIILFMDELCCGIVAFAMI